MSMRSHINVVEELTRTALPRDTDLSEDIAMLGEDALFEMSNLPMKMTGVPGIIFISTASGSHGARVKYYSMRPGAGQPSFSVTIADEPQVVASSLPDHVVRKMAPLVIEWVKINRQALLHFWINGTSMLRDEVTAFEDSLKPVR